MSSTISLTASTAGFVNLWIDLDGNGNWQAGERVLSDQAVSAGTQQLPVTLSFDATPGPSFARVRFTTDNPAGALGPGGDWGNGEVEDHAVTIDTLSSRLRVTKTVRVFDPEVENLFAVPGNDVTYSIGVENIGLAETDLDSVFVVDALPPEVEFFNGDADGPGSSSDRVLFSSDAPGLTLDPIDDVGFATGSIPPNDFDDCTHPGTSGYDPSIRFVCIRPRGQLGPVGPAFSVDFRARIR